MCLSIDQLVGIDGATRNITEPMLPFIIWRIVPQGLQLTWGSNSLTKWSVRWPHGYAPGGLDNYAVILDEVKAFSRTWKWQVCMPWHLWIIKTCQWSGIQTNTNCGCPVISNLICSTIQLSWKEPHGHLKLFENLDVCMFSYVWLANISTLCTWVWHNQQHEWHSTMGNYLGRSAHDNTNSANKWASGIEAPMYEAHVTYNIYIYIYLFVCICI